MVERILTLLLHMGAVPGIHAETHVDTHVIVHFKASVVRRTDDSVESGCEAVGRRKSDMEGSRGGGFEGWHERRSHKQNTICSKLILISIGFTSH